MDFPLTRFIILIKPWLSRADYITSIFWHFALSSWASLMQRLMTSSLKFVNLILHSLFFIFWGTHCIDKSIPKMNGPNTMVLPSHGSLESASWPLFYPTRNDSFHLKWNFSSGFVYLQDFLPFLCNNFGCVHCFAAPWSLHDSCKESGSCEGHWPEWLSRSYQHWTIWMSVGVSCSLSCHGRKATELGPWVTR